MRRKTIDEIGTFNVLLVGDNSHGISIADTIHAEFSNDNGKSNVSNQLEFNIMDMDGDGESHSWFNEFVFEVATTAGRFNNIMISRGFVGWLKSNPPEMEKLYVKMLLQALNVVIVDVSSTGEESGTFDNDIPQTRFDVTKDFGVDLFKWIDKQYAKVLPKLQNIRLVRSLSGKNIPYLGDVFGCLSGKKYKDIVHSDKMRFDSPILFDEFCSIMKGKTEDEMKNIIVTRRNSALSAFFK